MSFHPMQEIVMVGELARFKENKLVTFLKDNCQYDLNQLHEKFGRLFSIEDWTQFYQQIGYSVSGYGDLSFIPRDIVQKADEIACLLHEGVVEYTDKTPSSKVKPDILIVAEDPVHRKVYSTDPEALGKICFVSEHSSNTTLIDIQTSEKIKGSSDEWVSELFEGSTTTLKEFLEKFIIQNT